MDCIGFNDASWASWMTPVDDYPNRESWLLAGAERLLTSILPKGTDARPKAFRVSVGWPKGKRGEKLDGQCWDPAVSADGTVEIFIAPSIDVAEAALETLAHELIHASVGNDEGHKGAFKACAQAIGFLPPMTSTPASPALAQKLAIIALQLGPYPHARLIDLDTKKQTTRMLKATCPNEDCEIKAQAEGEKPYTVRITALWAELGMPTCPCGTQMELDAPKEGEAEALAA